MTWSELLLEAQQRLQAGMPEEAVAEMRLEAKQLLAWTSQHSSCVAVCTRSGRGRRGNRVGFFARSRMQGFKGSHGLHNGLGRLPWT